MTDENKPHPSNAPGSFYVVDGCCTACGVPLDAAPSLFAYDERDHCYVKRQPAAPTEVVQALWAVRRAELRCIRYRGTDPQVLQRLAEQDSLDVCDARAALDLRPLLRDHVTFSCRDSESVAGQRQELVSGLLAYLRSAPGPDPYRVRGLTEQGDESTLEVAWFEDQFHLIGFRQIDLERGPVWLAWHRGNLGVSELLDCWLKSDARYVDVRWYSGMPGPAATWRDTPW